MCAEDEGWPILLDRILVTWLSLASQNLPLGLCGQHSWGRYCFSARVIRVWECESGPLYVSSSCSWTYICTRAEHIGANDISESQGVMKLISPSDFCYPTQCIPLLFKINKRLARVLCRWVVLTQGAFGGSGVHQHWKGPRTTTHGMTWVFTRHAHPVIRKLWNLDAILNHPELSFPMSPAPKERTMIFHGGV